MLSKIYEKYPKHGSNTVCLSYFDSPLGKLISAADTNFLYFILFEDSKDLDKKLQTLNQEINCTFVEDKNDILKKLDTELTEYFKGNIKKFTVPLKTHGTAFQKDVWNKLLEVPYGSTYTYGDLAISLGRPASHARAVGAACGANSHILLIPCHRLVATASKGGFSCGIDRKEWLLKHEKKFV
ncbi:methylated-DNA--protein-cysteine methyltransferase [Papilio machaon]|uniref:methylated-DNA--protein-cysteine methyltransferase n=1 Tax=Papilio machaon TaxID=76193 RepID=UPI001E6660CE|nr:methylated-DNA--protein-cysteine methyltransferase [Papilio machaon]